MPDASVAITPNIVLHLLIVFSSEFIGLPDARLFV
jgi:hypothetical protein